ncbi:preprotein translocase subunit YajC [Frigoribacterium endophyticum]|uniref:preprotein translocase subunit YajC n=1 Tax=Frigoribacterium endophyticum TaxID=1522176 RepID=UPI0014200AF2|nr:preprotein translocase subunit YajC [Frigoribacterium endophyticum]NII50687.1 preprotein translocase subunit YajC [Frigoribacterium endophyticum]
MDATSLIMVLLLVVLVFFMFRNKKKRDRQQAELQTALVPGVEVMLTFGVYGTIVSVDDETTTAEVEVAPGTVLKVHRQTLGRVVTPPVAADDDTVVADADEVDGRPAGQPVDLTKPAFGERAPGDRVDTSASDDENPRTV